jgi:hypothetical protein
MRRDPRVLCCPNLVFSFRRMVCFIAAAPRRRVLLLRGGSLLGVVASAPLFQFSALNHVVDSDVYMSVACGWELRICSVFSDVSMCSGTGRVDVSIRVPDEW